MIFLYSANAFVVPCLVLVRNFTEHRSEVRTLIWNAHWVQSLSHHLELGAINWGPPIGATTWSHHLEPAFVSIIWSHQLAVAILLIFGAHHLPHF